MPGYIFRPFTPRLDRIAIECAYERRQLRERIRQARGDVSLDERTEAELEARARAKLRRVLNSYGAH